ncbi:hypothetical protein B0H11DRAFT_1918848 [Mycena galericulata]|nr:hypothetical protein B0H11DRAFT_1918848 [Mycena galericulata]
MLKALLLCATISLAAVQDTAQVGATGGLTCPPVNNQAFNYGACCTRINSTNLNCKTDRNPTFGCGTSLTSVDGCCNGAVGKLGGRTCVMTAPQVFPGFGGTVVAALIPSDKMDLVLKGSFTYSGCQPANPLLPPPPFPPDSSNCNNLLYPNEQCCIYNTIVGPDIYNGVNCFTTARFGCLDSCCGALGCFPITEPITFQCPAGYSEQCCAQTVLGTNLCVDPLNGECSITGQTESCCNDGGCVPASSTCPNGQLDACCGSSGLCTPASNGFCLSIQTPACCNGFSGGFGYGCS